MTRAIQKNERILNSAVCSDTLKTARRRELRVIVVWHLDSWRLSVFDLITTPRELTELGIGFVPLTQAMDLTTATGRAMAGMLAVFPEFVSEILRERVHARIAQVHREGRPHGRPSTASLKFGEILRLKAERLSQRRSPGGSPGIHGDHAPGGRASEVCC
jgi:putative DNA-invertase from lambdoid prophage Rac